MQKNVVTTIIKAIVNIVKKILKSKLQKYKKDVTKTCDFCSETFCYASIFARRMLNLV